MWRVVGALTFVFAAFALYTVLTSKALDEGLSPGVLVLLRDMFCTFVLVLNLRLRESPSLLPHPEDQAPIILLGIFGLYFGQYLGIVGIQHSDAVLVSLWGNLAPVATYLLGLILRTEQCALDWVSALKLSGLVVTVTGAVMATLGDSKAGTGSGITSLAVATVCFLLQVLFGSAVFWHLQKLLLGKGYSVHQMAAWYYTSGMAVLLLVVVPHTSSSDWTFNKDDLTALGVAIPVWPLCAFLLTFANEHATPTTVMVFSPAQIVFTFLFDYLLYGQRPSLVELAGAACVVLGLLLFCSATASRLNPVREDQLPECSECSSISQGASSANQSSTPTDSGQVHAPDMISEALLPHAHSRSAARS